MLQTIKLLGEDFILPLKKIPPDNVWLPQLKVNSAKLSEVVKHKNSIINLKRSVIASDVLARRRYRNHTYPRTVDKGLNY